MFDLSFIAGWLQYLILLAAGACTVLGAYLFTSGLRRRPVVQLKPALHSPPSPNVDTTARSTGKEGLTVAQKIAERIHRIDTKPAVGATTTAGTTVTNVQAAASISVTPRDVRTIVTAPPLLTSGIVARRQKFGWIPPRVPRIPKHKTLASFLGNGIAFRLERK